MSYRRGIWISILCFCLSNWAVAFRCFTCIDAPSNEDCNKRGGIVECAANEQSCQNEVRLSEGFKYQITKRCKQPLACHNNQAQNDKPAWDPTQCNPAFSQNSVCKCCCDTSLCNKEALPCDEKPKCSALTDILNGRTLCSTLNLVGSICSFSCERGFTLIGSRDTECTNENEEPEWSQELPFCQRTTCSDDISSEQVNGGVSCSDSNFAFSVCEFSCNVGYWLRGRTSVVCASNGQWNDQFSSCERVQCTRMDVANSISSCSDQNYYGSQCLFECLPGYRIEGSTSPTCQDNSNWSSPPPRCVREPCNPEILPPQNGTVSCTRRNLPLSTCTFSCGKEQEQGWEIYGETSTTCQLNSITDRFEWNYKDTPCCARVCPPHALVDLFLVLDSSSSVGIENWNRTLYFINDVIQQFEISLDDVLIAAIRYNRYVDTSSEIRIGQYLTKPEIMNAIINLPYDGSGTLTGNALQYVVENMLTLPSNRAGVKDIVLVVTDGVSSDDVIAPSRQLREAGAMIIALGVLKKGGNLREEDIVNISGNEETAFLVDSGFQGLSNSVIDVIEKQVCGKNPCV